MQTTVLKILIWNLQLLRQDVIYWNIWRNTYLRTFSTPKIFLMSSLQWIWQKGSINRHFYRGIWTLLAKWFSHPPMWRNKIVMVQRTTNHATLSLTSQRINSIRKIWQMMHGKTKQIPGPGINLQNQLDWKVLIGLVSSPHTPTVAIFWFSTPKELHRKITKKNMIRPKVLFSATEYAVSLSRSQSIQRLWITGWTWLSSLNSAYRTK